MTEIRCDVCNKIIRVDSRYKKVTCVNCFTEYEVQVTQVKIKVKGLNIYKNDRCRTEVNLIKRVI